MIFVNRKMKENLKVLNKEWCPFLLEIVSCSDETQSYALLTHEQYCAVKGAMALLDMKNFV